MAGRLIYLLLTILAVLWLPSWLAIILGLVGIVRYHHFYEVIIPALLYDFLYSAAGTTLVGFPLMLAAFSLVVVYLLEDLKKIILVERW